MVRGLILADYANGMEWNVIICSNKHITNNSKITRFTSALWIQPVAHEQMA
jgi:hypothetical protein